jgi:hypothetical protein
MDEVAPPWIALPDLDPHEPATQGMPEAYIMLNWLPYWRTLSGPEKAAYLDRWTASAEWRRVIADRYDGGGEDIDWEDEARVAAEWRAAHVDAKPKARWRFWD